ncbi:MAG: prolyl oligopeptidase family serine peptidase, partial [Prevotella sp.]|nr:prolyl oligopeptidase family serine peptidase [Prevotella sp.]
NMNANHKIYYHKIGTPQSDDVLFYENPAYPKRFYDVTVNEEETMMFLTESGAGAGNNLFVRDLRKKDAQFIQLTSNMDLQYSPIETEGDKFYIYTNDGAPKGRLMVADIRQPGSTNWQEVIGQQQYAIESIDCIDHQFIVTYNQDASSHAYVYTMDGQLRHEVRLPSLGSVYFSGDKKDKECFYTFTSFTQPSTIYRYDINSNESPLYRAPKVAFKMNDFTTEQVFFQSKDGTRIPMFLTYKKGLKRNGKNPVYLYGYCGFNIALGPSFSATRIPFLESGGIYAQVNLRGGSEYGEEWHLAGTKMQKQNVFDDFIGAAEWLISEQYTSKEQLAIVGGSNGGLLVG